MDQVVHPSIPADASLGINLTQYYFKIDHMVHLEILAEAFQYHLIEQNNLVQENLLRLNWGPCP